MATEGDLNHDGKLDEQDLAFLRQLTLESPGLLSHLSEQEKACLDINHDGHINYDDIVALCGKIINNHEPATTHAIDKLTSLRNKLNR